MSGVMSRSRLSEPASHRGRERVRGFPVEPSRFFGMGLLGSVLGVMLGGYVLWSGGVWGS